MTNMKQHLEQLRNDLIKARNTYLKADGSLDSSPTAVIVAKEELRLARYHYSFACQIFVEKLYFSEESV